MSDSRQNPPPSPGSNNTIIFIVGALVVAVGVLGYMFVSGPAPSGDSAPAVTIENNTTTTAPAADPAPAEPAPAEPAPAEPAPEPAAPAPAAPAANP